MNKRKLPQSWLYEHDLVIVKNNPYHFIDNRLKSKFGVVASSKPHSVWNYLFADCQQIAVNNVTVSQWKMNDLVQMRNKKSN